MKAFIAALLVSLVLIAGGSVFEQHAELKRQEKQRHVAEIITIHQHCELWGKMEAPVDAARCRADLNSKIVEYGLQPTDFLN
ncbi:MAG: hypothetical protein ABSF97_18080 [Candidatus Sulfotelmatobacter sp.]|jgi:hypothetical protein|nr:hypothetical protein [Terriglobales bacterium]